MLAACGILAPIVYVAALVIGNILDPSYSQIGKTVSELIQRDAPNRDLLNAIFIIYNILLIPFGFALYRSLNTSKTRVIILALLILDAVLGVAWTLFFPLDAGGKIVSLTANLHVIVGIPVVFAIFIMEAGFWHSTRKDSRWRGYDKFSLVIFAVTFVFGLTTVALVNSDLRGLFERITTGSFLLWIEVLSIKIYKGLHA